MTFQRLATVGLALVPAAMLTVAGIVAGQAPQQVPAPGADAKGEEPGSLVPALNLAAVDRFRFQQEAFTQGRITIDRMIQASERLMEVQWLFADNDLQRVRALKDHVGRLKEIDERERVDFAAGRSTQADVTEAREARLLAEYRLRKALEPGAARTVEALSARVENLERRLRTLEGALSDPVRGDFPKLKR